MIVTASVKVFVPVLARVRVPVTEVVPVTDKVQVLVAPEANVVPVPTSRFPPIVSAAAVAAVAVPLKVRSPLIVIAAGNVLAPEPESVKLL